MSKLIFVKIDIALFLNITNGKRIICWL